MNAPGKDRYQYGGLDLFRIPAALLVVAVHTGPLLTVSAQANYLITDILARLAVPFFLAVSGFFLAPEMRKSWRGLRHFSCKVLLLYGVSILSYLPLMVRNGYFDGCTLRSLAADLVFNGPSTTCGISPPPCWGLLSWLSCSGGWENGVPWLSACCSIWLACWATAITASPPPCRP